MDKQELKQHRIYGLGITQRELAERMGVSLSLVRAWECGGRKIGRSYEILLKYLLTTKETIPRPLRRMCKAEYGAGLDE